MRTWNYNMLLLAQALLLIPQPQTVRVSAGEVQLRVKVPEMAAPATLPGLTIGRAGTPAIDAEIARRKLDGAVLSRPQAYLLDVAPAGVLIAARDAAGLFYGVQTLRQLVRPGGRVPRVSIADWPALPYRGLSIDISRGPVLTEEQMQTVIRRMAEYKLNLLSFYMEHVYQYRHAPLVAPSGAGITPELMKRLAAYARNYHVELVPQQQTFGHLHHMLKLEMYSGMATMPHGSVLAPDDERAYDWIGKAAADLAATFPGPFLHIGSDETFGIPGEAYMRHMRRVTEMLRPLDRKLMFWGDIALSHPELMSELPRDLIALTWNYDAKPDFTPMIEPFRKNGMQVFVCPGLNNWYRIYPNLNAALPNINRFVADGKRLDAAGMLNTHWNDEGESLFNLNWYGILFSAAAAWQSGDVDTAVFDRAFDWAFHRNTDTRVAAVIGRFTRINELMDASDRLFWMDPFSAAGARTMATALPAASEARMLAEQNLVDLASLEVPEHGDALLYLKLAARRLDWLEMKIQYATQIAESYRHAREHPDDARRDLRRISGTNGYVQDLREGILELKQAYREAWLAENRPYWLENVLIRYDAEALYWQNKARVFATVLQNYQATKQLPEVLPQ